MYKYASRKPVVERTTPTSTSPTRRSKRRDIAVGINNQTVGVEVRTATEVGASRNNTQGSKSSSRESWNQIQKNRGSVTGGKDRGREATQQNAKQVEELEEYVKVQETCCTTQLVVKDKLLEELNDKFNRQEEEWNTTRDDLERRCTEVENVAERRQLDLIIAQGHLLQTETTSNAQINDIWKALEAE